MEERIGTKIKYEPTIALFDIVEEDFMNMICSFGYVFKM